MSKKMEKVSSELFECPVCLEIPEGVVYQCKNGHSICEPCSREVSLCPQCRDKLGKKDKSRRNRTMEAFIAGMEVGCRFEKEGCSVKMQRKDLAAHLENACDFNPARSVRLCKILGFANCNLVIRLGGEPKPNNVFRHIMEEHLAPCGPIEVKVRHGRGSGSTSKKKTKGLVVLRKVGLSKSLEYMKKSQEHPESQQENHMMTTFDGIDADIEGSQFKLLVCYYTNIQQGIYSVICLNLGEEKFPGGGGITVEISVPAKSVRWIWNYKPIPLMKVEEAMANPPFQIPIPYLLDVLGDAKKLKCTISYF